VSKPSLSKGETMLRDDLINEGKIKPTKEDLIRRGETPPKPKKKKAENKKETSAERMTKPAK